MTPEITIVLIEQILRHGVPVVSKLILDLGREPTLDEIRALKITKKPEDYFTEGGETA